MNDIKMPQSRKRIWRKNIWRVIAWPFVEYEYLDTNIYYVTQGDTVIMALTVLLIINRSLFSLTCPQTDNSYKW